MNLEDEEDQILSPPINQNEIPQEIVQLIWSEGPVEIVAPIQDDDAKMQE